MRKKNSEFGMNLFALCKVFPITAVRNVTLMPHTFYDGPGLLAAIHVIGQPIAQTTRFRKRFLLVWCLSSSEGGQMRRPA